MSVDSYFYDLNDYAELLIDDVIYETPTHFRVRLLAEDAEQLGYDELWCNKNEARYVIADKKQCDGPTRVCTSLSYAEKLGVTGVMSDLRLTRGF